MIRVAFKLVLLLATIVYAKNKEFNEGNVLESVTKCLFTEVRDQPFNLAKTLQHPQSHVELCFTKCLFESFGTYNKDGVIDPEIMHASAQYIYGQADKVKQISDSCAKEIKLDGGDKSCEKISPLTECMVKYADIYGLDRNKHLV